MRIYSRGVERGCHRSDIGLSETRVSSVIEMLHHVPSFDLFTSNRNTPGGGVLLYVRHTLNVNKLVTFYLMLEHLETKFMFFFQFVN